MCSKINLKAWKICANVWEGEGVRVLHVLFKNTYLIIKKKERNALLTSCSANNYDFICLKAPDSSGKNRITSKGADAVSSSVSDPPDFLIPRV